jgi:hypothetical protein
MSIRAHEINDLVNSYGYEAQMGRKKRWPERVGAKFAAGTLDRIGAALADGEERTAFIREVGRARARAQGKGRGKNHSAEETLD